MAQHDDCAAVLVITEEKDLKLVAQPVLALGETIAVKTRDESSLAEAAQRLAATGRGRAVRTRPRRALDAAAASPRVSGPASGLHV